MSEAAPVRIQMKRTPGWRMPPDTVKVDRSTKWGNPWRIGEPGIPDAAEAVRRFTAAVKGFRSNGVFVGPQAAPGSRIRAIIDGLSKLRGKNLACWCPLDQPCHADVLLELANASEAER